MSDIRIFVCMAMAILLCCLPCESAQDRVSLTDKELARQILANKDLARVLSTASSISF